MPRLEAPPLESMTAEQRAMHDLVAKQRSVGKVRGPFALLLNAPDIGGRVADMVNHFLSDTRVSHKLKELAIIAVARRYSARYEWFIHAPRAVRMGLAEETKETIRSNRRPDFTDPEEALVYDLAVEMAETRKLSDETYAKAKAALGEPALLELVSLVGFYVMVALLLNAYDVEVPDGGPDPFAES
jgi:4-carboxymuconolactone decarboxylase